jgi:hypothetical protein
MEIFTVLSLLIVSTNRLLLGEVVAVPPELLRRFQLKFNIRDLKFERASETRRSQNLCNISIRQDAGLDGEKGPALPVQLFLEAILQFRADLCNFHPRAHQELATQQFVRLVLIYELAGHTAILAILIPAETSIRNGFRADVLEAAENRILLRDFERLPKNLDLDQAFVWTKYLIGTARGDCFRDLRFAWL